MIGNYLILLCVVFCGIFQPSSGGGSTVMNLNIVSINSTAILVTWSGPPEANIVSYSATAVSPVRATSTTIQITTNIGIFPNYLNQNVTFTDLFPYTDYTISIDGTLSVGGSLNTLTQIRRTDEAVSAAPELITVSVENATTITATWFVPMELEQNGPIVMFIIDFSSNEIPGPYNQSYEIMDNFPIPCGTNYTEMFTVEEGITYVIFVIAVNGAGMSPASITMTVGTPVVAPPNAVPFPASEIVVLSETPTTITFSVPTVSIIFLNGPIVGYTIEYVGSLLSSALFEFTNSPNSTLDTTSVLSVDVAAGSGIVIVDLLPNYLYNWSISVRNELGSTLPQTITRKSPSALPSGAPINIALTAVSHQQINVSWSINLTTVNGQLRSFNVHYSTPGYSNSVVYSPINSTGPYQVSLTGLAANTLYSVRLSIVNSVGEGMQSSALTAETLPKIPSTDPCTVIAPTQSSSTTVQVNIPTQRLFPTANIAVIYVIAESSSPAVFSSYSPTQRYNSVSSISNGAILVDGAPSIRIQALLGGAYFNRLTNYFTFTVGSGGATSYNGISVNNVLLVPGTSYEISYYILFYNATGQTTPEFSFFNSLLMSYTPSRGICLACILIPIFALSLIGIILLVVIIALIYYLLWNSRRKKQTPSSIEVAPKKEKVRPQSSIALVEHESKNSPPADTTDV